MINVLFDYLTAEEQEQYQKARGTTARLESLDTLDWEEYTKQSGQLKVLEQIAQKRYIDHYSQLEDDPLQPLQEDYKKEVQGITKAEYDSRFITDGEGKTIFKGDATFFNLLPMSKDDAKEDVYQEIRQAILSHTKEGFIEYVDAKADILPALAYLEWVRNQGKKNPDFEGLAAVKAFNQRGIIEEWAEEQYTPLTAEQVIAKRAEIAEYPIDKVNNTVWDALKEDADGQIGMQLIRAERPGDKEINIIYTIDFNELEEAKDLRITKNLSAYDKRVYVAIGALFNAGNRIVTLTQIHYAMGNSKRPSANQLEKIFKSVYKMQTARILLDNKQEIEKGKYDYKQWHYIGYLLPLEAKVATVNGKITEAAIGLYKEPPLITFAKERKQVTTIPIKLLDSPISKTDDNLAIEDYLLERIARAKADTIKILLKTLYEKAGITTTKQRQRTPRKLQTYLDHYKSEGFIKSYTLTKDYIEIKV